MAQDEVLFVFSKEERNKLLDATVKALESKLQNFSDTLSIDSTLYLAASIMKIDDTELEATIYDDDENSLFFEQGKISTKLAEIILYKLSDGGHLNE